MRIHAEKSQRLEDTEALSTRAMKKLSDKQRLIQEQAHLIKEKERESKVMLEAVENLKEKQWAHAEIAKRLEEAEVAMNKLSEKEKIIQEQANLIKEKEKAAEMFEEKERSHAEMAKRLGESEATSTRTAIKLSEKQKIIQEQGNLIK